MHSSCREKDVSVSRGTGGACTVGSQSGPRTYAMNLKHLASWRLKLQNRRSSAVHRSTGSCQALPWPAMACHGLRTTEVLELGGDILLAAETTPQHL